MAQNKVDPYVRSNSFDSVEAMDQFDAELIAVLWKHEEYRHQCEVRTLLKIAHDQKDWTPVAAYYRVVEKKRGKDARERLAKDVRAQWLAGNRGQKGVWK